MSEDRRSKTVRSKVAAGEYASESEVIQELLARLIARDRGVDAWLKLAMADVQACRVNATATADRPS